MDLITALRLLTVRTVKVTELRWKDVLISGDEVHVRSPVRALGWARLPIQATAAVKFLMAWGGPRDNPGEAWVVPEVPQSQYHLDTKFSRFILRLEVPPTDDQIELAVRVRRWLLDQGTGLSGDAAARGVLAVLSGNEHSPHRSRMGMAALANYQESLDPKKKWDRAPDRREPCAPQALPTDARPILEVQGLGLEWVPSPVDSREKPRSASAKGVARPQPAQPTKKRQPELSDNLLSIIAPARRRIAYVPGRGVFAIATTGRVTLLTPEETAILLQFLELPNPEALAAWRDLAPDSPSW